MRGSCTLLVLAAALAGAGCGGNPLGDATERAERRIRTARLLARLDDPAVLDKVVELGQPDVVRRALAEQYPLAVRRAACVALARIGATDVVRAVAEEGGVLSEAARIALAEGREGGDVAVRELLDRARREDETRALLGRGLRRDAVARLAELEAVDVLAEAAATPGRNGEWAALALGVIGSAGARAALEGLAARPADDMPARRLRLFAREALAVAAGRKDVDEAVRDIRVRLEKEAKGKGVWSWIDATAADRPEPERRQACVALARAARDGNVGRREARERLVELLSSNTGEPLVDGPIRLYAAVGLTLLRDPATAVDLVLQLSAVNPDDNLAAFADEIRNDPYWTTDAQICDALLGLGVWEAEEDLLEQMGRRHRIRVLIDAHAVLRRRTGLALPFRYNGSYADRDADIAAWRERLRATRARRYEQRRLDVDDPTYRARLRVVLSWLEGRRVNERYIAEKVLARLGPYAVDPLVGELRSDNPIARRQAALMLGRIGDRRAVPGLVGALDSKDADARARALEALRKLEGRTAVSRAVTLLRDEDGEVRAEAARFLGALGGEEHAGPLRRTLREETLPATRTAILSALLRLGDGSVRPELERIAREGEQHERQEARAALEEEK